MGNKKNEKFDESKHCFYVCTRAVYFQSNKLKSDSKNNDVPPPNIAKNNYQVFGRVLTYIINL